MKFFTNFFKILRSFVPDYSELMKLGYSAAVENHDFRLEKKIKNFKIQISQSLEPFNQKYGNDFSIDLDGGACVIIELPSSDFNSKEIIELFENSVQKDKYLFLYDDHMDFYGNKIAKKLQKLEELLIQIT